MNVKEIAIANPDIFKIKATHRTLLALASNHRTLLALASNHSKKLSVTILD